MNQESTTAKVFLANLEKLELLCKKANATKNPLEYLYKNDARTVAFHLQGLARMYKTFVNEKRFTKILNDAKIIEDSLGSWDFMQWVLAWNKKTFKNAALEAEMKDELQSLADACKSWLEPDDKGVVGGIPFAKYKKKLETADWLSAEKESIAIQKYFSKRIEKIEDLVAEKKDGFTSTEEDIHELRRQMRWLSIIAGAMQGKIQLKKNAETKKEFAELFTKKEIESPFNHLKKAIKGETVVYLDENAFLSLSRIIAQLGDLKDEGLKLEMQKKWDKKSKATTEKQISAVLETAHALVTHFMVKNVLSKLSIIQ
jgi:hypothetical protein